MRQARPRRLRGRAAAAAGRSRLAALALLTLAAFWPPALNLLAASLAASLGCGLDEDAPHPCPLGGRDVGPTLNDGYVLGGWLSLVTAPAMLVALGFWAAVVLRHCRARRGFSAP